MKLISLTQGKFAMVDDEDYDFLMQWKWCATKHRDTYYAKRKVYLGGGRANPKAKEVKMHRLIMNTPDHIQVDHEDHNGLNNQKSNLRNCTNSQNQYNKKHRNKHGYKGITFLKQRKTLKWVAHINYNKKLIYLGGFKTKEEAAIAFDRAAQKYHKEFAYPNFKECLPLQNEDRL